jgi:hypothetical protein
MTKPGFPPLDTRPPKNRFRDFAGETMQPDEGTPGLDAPLQWLTPGAGRDERSPRVFAEEGGGRAILTKL